MTQTDYTTASSMINEGSLCAEHIDPDLWFPEFSRGVITETRARNMASKIKEATDLCDVCPNIANCLNEGMKEENLAHGIWGGLLAGQRIELLGHKRDDFAPQSDNGKAMDFHERVKPWLG